MKISFLLTFIVLLQISCCIFKDTGSFCNGNCPQSDCDECVCGNTKNAVDINQWCKGANWNQGCCRCIVNLVSKGNSNYMRRGPYSGLYIVGLTGIQGRDGDVCGSKLNYDFLCNPDVHINCAANIYKTYGWSYWNESEACGCSNNKMIK